MSRNVLVTGGARGIGLSVARLFAERGDRVAVTYRSTPPPDDLTGVPCDVTEPDQVERAFSAVEAELGPVEVLVANAGTTQDRLMLAMRDEQFADVVDTNLTGAWRCARRAAGPMLRARWGRLIFVSSVVGFHGNAGQVNYAASKAGLVGLARSIARELGPKGITANVVAPGFVETDMTRTLSAELRREILRGIPVARFATADEVAATIHWLGSADAAYVTGSVMPVDGGLGMGH